MNQWIDGKWEFLHTETIPRMSLRLPPELLSGQSIYSSAAADYAQFVEHQIRTIAASVGLAGQQCWVISQPSPKIVGNRVAENENG